MKMKIKSRAKTSAKKGKPKTEVSSKHAKKAKQYAIEKILEDSEDYGSFLTACNECKISQKHLASYFNDSSNAATAAKTVHAKSWDLATLNTLAVCKHVLEKKLSILEALYSEDIISKESMDLFIYYFLKEGLEYAYPVYARAHKKTVVHCDFEYVLTTAQKLMSDKT